MHIYIKTPNNQTIQQTSKKNSIMNMDAQDIGDYIVFCQ